MTSTTALQPEIERVGRKLFDQIDAERSSRQFRRHDFYTQLLDWSMRDEAFKTQLFRFVDVLPALRSSEEVIRHLSEYLKDADVPIASFLRAALKLGGVVPPIPAALIRRNVSEMANIFIAGSDAKSALANLRRIWQEGARFTADILGEAVVSDKEADEYAARYLALLNVLADATRGWSVDGPLAPTEPPLVNVSVKISALCARVQTTDPDASIVSILQRLVPILGRAGELGAFINLDMEHFGLKDLTIELFKKVGADPRFRKKPHLGLAVQSYLRSSLDDVESLLDWARQEQRQFTIRLVKGAYWDYEKVIAAQRTWVVPVYLAKQETDANFEAITRLLLENRGTVYPAFASHNVRSIAHAIVYADHLGLKPGDYEFQMLYGMAEPVRRALLRSGYRIREYCPIGELVPGMAYLVRRLLENTSNEGFLRARFSDHASTAVLLQDPATARPTPAGGTGRTEGSPTHAEPAFINEPPADFVHAKIREQMMSSISRIRAQLGRKYPLWIGGKPVETPSQFSSVNPARPSEIVGTLSAAGVEHVAAAVTAARKAFPFWRDRSPEERAALLDRVASILRQRRFDLAAWEVFEVGKTWAEADGDVVEAIDFCTFYAEEMRRLAPGRLTQNVPGEVSVEFYLPRGVGAIIAPWNFPLAILCGMTVAAVVSGNTVVIKPAEQSSVIGHLFGEIFQEAGAPPGVVNLLSGSGEGTGAYLVAHPQVDFVAFTGSQEVGTAIWATAGVTHPDQPNLKKVICEMGGKNAVIVDTDADLDEVVTGVLQSAFGYQGQKCSALSRLITVGNVADQLVPRLVEACAALRIGLPEDPGTDLGPVIDEEAKTKILRYQELGRNTHTLAFQANPATHLSGYFVPLTIFTEVDRQSPLAQEEIFGPVLSIIRAADLDEALNIANDTRFALTGGFYSRSPQNIEKVRRRFLVGNLYINRVITGAIVGRHPFGGFKMSGAGTKAGGRDYLLHFTFPRVVTENTLRRGFAPEHEKTDG